MTSKQLNLFSIGTVYFYLIFLLWICMDTQIAICALSKSTTGSRSIAWTEIIANNKVIENSVIPAV